MVTKSGNCVVCQLVSAHQNSPPGAIFPAADVVQMVAEQDVPFLFLESKEAEAEQETAKKVKPHPEPPRQGGGPHKEPGKLWQCLAQVGLGG